MNKEIKTFGVLRFLKKNWFQVTVALLAVYFFFRKDLSFQIQVKSPDKVEKNVSKPLEKYTDVPAPVEEKELNRLEIPLIGGKYGKKNLEREFTAIDEKVKETYLRRFVKVATEEQKRFGIPASVILSLALYESCAGQRDMALEVNNHFSLPCTGNWSGQCREYQGMAFRKYESPWASFRDFSEFSKTHFSGLRGKNHRSWTQALETAGFGSSAGLAAQLESLIENYSLEELDR